MQPQNPYDISKRRNMSDLGRLGEVITTFYEREKMLAIAESCTGGYVSHMITNLSGSSLVFERGVVSYSNQAKIQILNVDPDIIKNHGAVSEEVVRQMAEGIRKTSDVDMGIGITGIAGPTGATIGKPIGLVYIGYSDDKETIVNKFIFETDRKSFKKLVLKEIIKYLEEYLSL